MPADHRNGETSKDRIVNREAVLHGLMIVGARGDSCLPRNWRHDNRCKEWQSAAVDKFAAFLENEKPGSKGGIKAKRRSVNRWLTRVNEYRLVQWEKILRLLAKFLEQEIQGHPLTAQCFLFEGNGAPADEYFQIDQCPFCDRPMRHPHKKLLNTYRDLLKTNKSGILHEILIPWGFRSSEFVRDLQRAVDQRVVVKVNVTEDAEPPLSSFGHVWDLIAQKLVFAGAGPREHKDVSSREFVRDRADHWGAKMLMLVTGSDDLFRTLMLDTRFEVNEFRQYWESIFKLKCHVIVVGIYSLRSLLDHMLKAKLETISPIYERTQCIERLSEEIWDEFTTREVDFYGLQDLNKKFLRELKEAAGGNPQAFESALESLQKDPCDESGAVDQIHKCHRLAARYLASVPVNEIREFMNSRAWLTQDLSISQRQVLETLLTAGILTYTDKSKTTVQPLVPHWAAGWENA